MRGNPKAPAEAFNFEMQVSNAEHRLASSTMYGECFVHPDGFRLLPIQIAVLFSYRLPNAR
jgi:hypothetical protein